MPVVISFVEKAAAGGEAKPFPRSQMKAQNMDVALKFGHD